MAKLKRDKHEAFCQEYLKDLNQTKAALRVGYGNGDAAKAQVVATRIWKRPEIQRRVQELMNARSERTEISADVILYELALLARSDVAQAFDADNNLLPIREMPEHVRRAISSVEVDEIWEGRGEGRRVIGHTKKIKFWDKTKSLELLGKHLKLFADKLEVEHKVTLESLVAGANEDEPIEVDSEVIE